MGNHDLLRRLKAVECPDATAMLEPPLVLAHAQGHTVVDAEGREYVDLGMGFGVLPFGHNPPHLKAVWDRLSCDPGQLIHGMGDVYASTDKLAVIEQLISILPPHLSRAALALTGGQAIELAIKTALLQAPDRPAFITFAGGYHGLDLGILPLTSRPAFSDPFRAAQAFPVHRLPFGATEDELSLVAGQIKREGCTLAGVLVEPIQGRSGFRYAGIDWLKTLREFCDHENGLLIFDEVFTGLGRSGRLTFADEIACDLLCLGKALGGGLPLSACVGTENAYSAWPESAGEAIHTGTFFGHPLSCRLASATLGEIMRRDLPKLLEQTGRDLASALSSLELGTVHDLRQFGGMVAVEFSEPGLGVRWMHHLRRHGVLALASGDSGECLSMTPAVMDEASLPRLSDIPPIS